MRKRATAVVVRDGKVLLVRERGRREYSLPGGGVDRQRDLVVLSGSENCRGCYAANWTGVPCNGPHRTRPSSRLAALRELREEVGLRADHARFLFHHQGAFNRHSVYLVGECRGHCKADGREVDGFLWWDGDDEVRMNRSTRDILARFRREHVPSSSQPSE